MPLIRPRLAKTLRALGHLRGPLSPDSRLRQRGQVLPIFVVMTVVLLGGAALLTDVAWWWVSQQRMQRAADAGALAGAVYLPGNEALAFSRARSEVAKNGYASGGGTTVTPRRDAGDPRKLIVDIDGPVSTHFAKIFAMDSIDASVVGAASFVLPVPMGSPENYYGDFGKLRTPGGGTTETTTVSGVTDILGPGRAVAGQWTTTSGSMLDAVQSVDGTYAQTDSNYRVHRFGNFGLLGSGQIPSVSANQSLTIDGIEVYVDDTHITGSCANTFVEAHLSWNGGSSWSSPNPGTANDSGYLNGTPQDFALGSATDLRAFYRTWSRSNFADGSFEVRLRSRKGGTCSGVRLRVDQLRIRVYYTLTTSVFIPDANIDDPYGQPLAPQGLWGTFINQGAHKINGDAFLPKWDPRTSGTNDEYDPEAYYNYALEIPAGANNGELWIYDPVFCGTNGNGRYGTGDRWFGSTNQTSAFYTLYDTMNTPYIFADDVVVGQSGSLFKNIRASDESLYGPDLGPPGASTDCSVGATANQNDGRYWHNRWWPMSSGLAGGKTYRLHTRSTDPDNAGAMDQANGHNSFALWSQATGGTPRIYGLGAMQAFTPLNGGGAATFYLARIDAEHAGKTMVIKLWDPGDTGNLTADLKILKPTASAYAETTFSYSAERVASGASYCSSAHGSNVSSVRTNTGGYKVFNGCWLTIEIPLPADYTAPRPATEDPSVEGGWWKIRYVMGGSSSDAAFDLTTWQVELRGNPVHLVLE